MVWIWYQRPAERLPAAPRGRPVQHHESQIQCLVRLHRRGMTRLVVKHLYLMERPSENHRSRVNLSPRQASSREGLSLRTNPKTKLSKRDPLHRHPRSPRSWSICITWKSLMHLNPTQMLLARTAETLNENNKKSDPVHREARSRPNERFLSKFRRTSQRLT